MGLAEWDAKASACSLGSFLSDPSVARTNAGELDLPGDILCRTRYS